MFFMQLRLKLSQVRNKLKEKQTFGGDHIFREDSASSGDWGAETSSPLAPPELQGRLAN